MTTTLSMSSHTVYDSFFSFSLSNLMTLLKIENPVGFLFGLNLLTYIITAGLYHRKLKLGSLKMFSVLQIYLFPWGPTHRQRTAGN